MEGWNEGAQSLVTLVNKVLQGQTGLVGEVWGFRIYGVDRRDLADPRDGVAALAPPRPWIVAYGTLPRGADLEHGDVLRLLPDPRIVQAVDYLELSGGLAHEMLKGGAVVVKDRLRRSLPHFLDASTEHDKEEYPWKGCPVCDFPNCHHRFGCSVGGRQQLILHAEQVPEE